ncbi:MAG: hypothetical protein V5788_05940 [Shewanella sp.]
MSHMGKNNDKADAALDLSNSPPTAGEQRDIPLGQALFFSPLPTAQGDGLDINGSFLEVNDVYLDIGSSNSGKNFQVQMYTSAFSFFVWCVWYYFSSQAYVNFTEMSRFIHIGFIFSKYYKMTLRIPCYSAY